MALIIEIVESLIIDDVKYQLIKQRFSWKENLYKCVLVIQDLIKNTFIIIERFNMWIILEGVDGSGKTTAIEYLKNKFESEGKEVVVTKGIGSGLLGETLRELVVEQEYTDFDMNVLAFPLAIMDCIRQSVAALKEGKIVITDRLVSSYYAYSKETIIELDICEYLLNYALKLHKDTYVPLLGLLIDSNIDTCINRIKTREVNNSFDTLSKESLESIYTKLKFLNSGGVTVSNNGTLEDFKQNLDEVIYNATRNKPYGH